MLFAELSVELDALFIMFIDKKVLKEEYCKYSFAKEQVQIIAYFDYSSLKE